MMQPLTTGLALAVAVAAGSTAADEPVAPVAPTASCRGNTEVLSIAPHDTFSTARGTDSPPVYEVKYRHCGRVHRLLIQVPDDETDRRQTPLDPMFF